MATFTHKRLRSKPGLWRVDGIAPLSPGHRPGTRTAVLFSEITEDGKNAPYAPESRTQHVLRFPIHTASILDFTVGSLWRDGRKVASPPVLKDLFCVDAGRMRLVELGKPVISEALQASAILGDQAFDIGKNRIELSSTQYVFAPILNNTTAQWLIVPCSELLRFYSGCSSRFLSGMLQGSLDQYVDWSKCRLDGGHPIVHARRQLNIPESAVIARAVVNKYAREAIDAPHRHLARVQLNNTSNGEGRLAIRSFFPFLGTTDLQIAGKQTRITDIDGKEHMAVFAMEIKRCMHPFDCNHAIIESEVPFDGEGYKDEQIGGAAPPRNLPKLDDDETEYELDDVPADQRLPRLVTLTPSNQFSALSDFKLIHCRPPSSKKSGKPGPRIDVPVKTLTVADGTSARDAQGNLGVSTFQSQIDHVSRDLTQFIELLACLRTATKSREWEISTRTHEGSHSRGPELIAPFPTNFGKRHSWHLIAEPNGKSRPRQVIWTEIALETPEQYFYLLEMELRPGEKSGQCTLLIQRHDLSSMEDHTFERLLRLTVVNHRWPKPDDEWKRSHQQDFAKQFFAENIIHRIAHPPFKKAPVKTAPVGQENSEPLEQGLNPETWSATLLAQIDELIGVTSNVL